MNPERWQQIDQLFHSALEREGAEQAAFLAQACLGDERLRQEVESLLASHRQAASFIETPAGDAAAELLAGRYARLTPGTMVNRYKILDLLGKGGMGEVYLALDLRLGRKVALKLLSTYLSSDGDRLLRFEQEARAASALSHANVCVVHEVGEAEGGRHYIVMEYVAGLTLRKRMADSRMKMSEVLDTGLQVAAALTAAHKAGIVHRDIKPENVILSTDGYLKVLDFGLAKLTEHPTFATDSEAATQAQVKTNPGMVMGTVQYMSPEQARGKGVDARTDIWSLGVVLYEMVTARVPFEGETPSHVIVSLLENEPDPLAHSSEVPAELERIVTKALRKNKEERYQTASDLALDLKSLKQELEVDARLKRSLDSDASDRETKTKSDGQTGQDPVNAPAARTVDIGMARPTSSAEYLFGEIKRHKRGLALSTAAIVVAVLMAFLYLWPAKPKAGESANSTLRFEFTRLTNASGEEAYPSLSPDGKSLVYSSYQGGEAAIYLLRIGGNTPIKLIGDSVVGSKQPTFSPDGNFIAFSSHDSGGIFVMGATGENVKRLTEFGANPSWSPDQKQIVFTTDDTWSPTGRRINPSELWLVNVETSEKHQLPTPGDAVSPSWSPHGERIAFWSKNNIFTMPAVGGQPVAVTNDKSVNWNPVWSPDGRYLYFASDRGGAMNLWRVPIDEKSGNVLGTAEALTVPAPHIQHLCFSRDGRHLAYVNDTHIQNVEAIQFDPQKEAVVGEPQWVTRGSTNIVSPDLAPDGERLAYGTLGDKQEDLFVTGKDGTGLRQLTNDVSKDRTPRWSPDGKRIAFQSDRSGIFEIWIMNADGSQLRQLTSTGAIGPIWSPEGTRLAYTARGGGGTFIAELKEAAGGLTTNVFSVPGSAERDFRAYSWSPDGRKLAGFSYRRRSNSPVKDPAHKLCTYSFDTQKFEEWEIEAGRPVWLNDNRRLIFVTGDTVCLLDTNSKRIRKVLSATPPEGLEFLALSRDNHKIFLTVATYEADIWLMTLQP